MKRAASETLWIRRLIDAVAFHSDQPVFDQIGAADAMPRYGRHLQSRPPRETPRTLRMSCTKHHGPPSSEASTARQTSSAVRAAAKKLGVDLTRVRPSGPDGVITLGAQPCSGNACPNPANIHIPVISDDADIRGEDQVCPAAVEVYTIVPYGGTDFVWSLSGGGTITEGQGTNRITVAWTDIPNVNTTYWLTVTYNNCYLGCEIGRAHV